MKIIGYQGIEGSNSEEAARLLADKLALKDFLLLPLVSSLNVLNFFFITALAVVKSKVRIIE